MSRRFALLAALLATPAHADTPTEIKVVISPDRKHVDFTENGALVGRYHLGPDVAKPYFWPLLAPGDLKVTRGWPMETGLPKETRDHVHQKSAWFCHGDVIPDGVQVVPSSDRRVKGVDTWSETKGHGRIVCVDFKNLSERYLVTSNEWRDSAGTRVLDEKRTIALVNAAGGRLFVFDVVLTASVCPVTFGDTKEGSFGVRVSDQLAIKSGGSKNQLVNADGKSGPNAVWGMLSDWNDYSGEVDGKPAGIAVFDHPTNKPRAAWHSRDYGLMAANPFGRKEAGFPALKGKDDLVKLGKGESLKLRYGIFLHTGDAKSGKVAEAFQVFAKPR